MITLYRKIKLWMLKAKWELALWQFVDMQLTELIEEPEELAKKFMPYLVELVHTVNKETN